MNNTFTINNVNWKIRFVDKNSDVLYRPDGSLTLGVTDRTSKTVYISNRLNGALLKKVVTHEICHCCIFSYGIYLTLEQEEYLCDFVAKYADEIVNLANDSSTKNAFSVQKNRVMI